MTRKVYQSVHFQTLDTYVMVKGQKVLIQFTGGSLKPKINGTYSTSDPDVIAAMDKGIVPDAAYKCISVDTTPDPPSAKPSEPAAKEDPPAKDLANVPDKDPEGAPPADGSFKEVPGIATVQAAKDYLLANIEGLTQSRLPNGTAVKAVAAENKIHFTDLK